MDANKVINEQADITSSFLFVTNEKTKEHEDERDLIYGSVDSTLCIG